MTITELRDRLIAIIETYGLNAAELADVVPIDDDQIGVETRYGEQFFVVVESL